MTAFTRKTGLLDREFDDPSVDALFRNIKREMDLQKTIVDRLAAPPHLPHSPENPNEAPPCKPR